MWIGCKKKNSIRKFFLNFSKWKNHFLHTSNIFGRTFSNLASLASAFHINVIVYLFYNVWLGNYLLKLLKKSKWLHFSPHVQIEKPLFMIALFKIFHLCYLSTEIKIFSTKVKQMARNTVHYAYHFVQKLQLQ